MIFSPENIDELLLKGFLIPNKWQCLRGPYQKSNQKNIELF